jgi:DNA-directed DNA polymerase III PolC
VSIVQIGVKTPWSLGLGASDVDTLCDAAQRRGISAVAFSDRNSLASAVPAWRACRAAGVRPVLGAELVGGGRRCWILVRDRRGYAAACAAVTAAHLDTSFDPVVQLRRASDGLYVISDDAAVLRALIPYVARRSLRAAVLPTTVERDAALAQEIGLAPVAVGDAHFASPAGHRVHRLLRARELGCAVDAVPAAQLAPASAWLAGDTLTRRAYASCPSALHEARRVTDGCTFDLVDDLAFGSPRFPRVGGGAPPHVALARRCRRGLRRLVGRDDGAHGRRLRRELGVVGELGFAPYFVMLADLAAFCRRSDIAHCGRGSAAGSVVAWTLGLTQVDPLEHGLLFERFLSRARRDLPDVDLDLDWRRRAEVIEHLGTTHGVDRVAGVATHVRFGLRGAVRAMGRTLGVDQEDVTRLSRALGGLPAVDDLAVADACRRHGIPAAREPWRSLLDAATAVAGLPRHLGLHPSGVVVGPQPLSRSIPLFRSASGPVATQWDGEAVAAAGWVKLDLLGNRSLGVLHDVRSSPPAKSLDDATADLLRQGATVGCFHLESPAVRSLMRRMECRTEGDVVAASAVVRPGVASSGMLRTYLDRRAGRPSSPIHPALARLLPRTHGVLVFQEDVMLVAHGLCGLPLVDADELRRALVQPHRRHRLAAFRERFVRGAAASGMSGADARGLWDQVASFAGYAFCRAHAASFARVGIEAAHHKAHRPAAFMAAVLSNGGGFYHPSVYLSECRRLGLRLESVCVQRGDVPYRGRGDRVRVGLMQVRALRGDRAERIVTQRRRFGPFNSRDDLADRVGLDDRELDALERCGALDAVEGVSLRTGPGRLLDEIDTLGVGVSGHPMDLLAPFMSSDRVPAVELGAHVGRRVLVAGWPVAARTLTTRGRPMELITLEDESGLLDAAVFPDAYERCARLLSQRVPCCARGRVTREDSVVSLVVEELLPVALPAQNAVA